MLRLKALHPTVRKVNFIIASIAAAAALAVPGVRNTGYAFHEGGVGACEGCHTMHNSVNGQPVTTGGSRLEFNGNAYLLLGADPSSTCLTCHQMNDATPTSFHIMSGATGAYGVPIEMTPGGDFAWLNISTSYVTSGGSAGNNLGTSHGHNIIAADYGLSASSVYSSAPGGTYPSNKLSCTSCHDPHSRARVNGNYQVVNAAIGQNAGPIIGSGSYGNIFPTTIGNNGAGEAVGVFRLLGGAGYQPSSVNAANAFGLTTAPPFAFAPQSYNRSEAVTDTRVAYGSGMSEWCKNCHANIHSSSDTTYQHPPGNNLTGTALLSNTDYSDTLHTVAQNYNRYINSGNLSGGNQATSYTSMVPYEEGLTLSATNYTTLASHAVSDGSYQVGPSTTAGATEEVMCLTCHRAHASGWPHALRWNAPSAAYLTVQGVYPGIDSTISEAQKGEYNLGYLQAQVQRTFYERPASNYGTYQTQLCSKCHS